MKFKKFFLYFILMLFIPTFVSASMVPAAKVGNKYYDSLLLAIEAAGENDVVFLVDDVKLEDTLIIDKKVNLNLNNHTISNDQLVFKVQDGELNVTGKGTIKENNPNYGAIMLVGSIDEDDIKYSSVKISSDVVLEGWSGIFINQNNKKAYGVNVDFSGKINAVNDTSGSLGAGIYVNGSIKHQENNPVININRNAVINSTGVGLYLAGNSKVTIGDAEISGADAGIAIKSGTLNVMSGTIRGLGADKTPTSGNNNGVNPSGAALQIESNKNYYGDMKINISGGAFESKNGITIYEYLGSGNTTMVSDLSISSGKFISGKDKNVFVLSNDFKTKNGQFISGGSFATDPSSYLKSGYKTIKNGNFFDVVSGTGVFEENILGVSKSDDNISSFGIITLIIIILLLLLYFSRKKILSYFNK